LIEHVGNSVIFFVAGALTGNVMIQVGWEDYGHLLVFYFVGTVIRGSFMILSIPILNSVGHSSCQPVTVADASVMCWGGLRGALGLALAIQVSLDRADGMVTASQAQRVLFYVAGIAFLTLVVNATSCPALVKYLQLNRPSGTKQMMMLNLKRKMSDVTNEHVGFNAIGDQLTHMMKEIERTVRVSIDPGIAQAAAKMNMDGSRGQDDGELLEQDYSGAIDSDTVSRIDRCCLAMGRKKSITGNLLKVNQLKYRLEEARQLFRGIKPGQLSLLGIPHDAPMMNSHRQKEAVQMLMSEGDNATSMQMQPINDVFLSLVEAKLWSRIQGGEFIGQEGEELLTPCAAPATNVWPRVAKWTRPWKWPPNA